MRRLPAPLYTILCAVVLSTGCSAPPEKEISRAQASIEAARTAGADQYAPEPFAAATTAFQQAQEAVEQRDYRLALTRAVDATERAGDAGREAVDGKARARRAAETAVNAVSAELPSLEAGIRTAETARLTPRDLAEARAVARNAAAALQKARALLTAENYKDARAAVSGLEDQIRAQIAAVTEATNARAARKPARAR
ncbi:MAG: hypothetical protein ABI818_10385 [Acidobacteriota bacterium]